MNGMQSPIEGAVGRELGEAQLSEPCPKRMKRDRQQVPPSRYKSIKVVDVPDAEYKDMSFEFATLSSGQTILLSEELWNVDSDGTFECLGDKFPAGTFARVPGYDLVVCSLSNYSFTPVPLKIGVFTLPGLHLVSTLDISVRGEGRAQYICADSSSDYGRGRVLVSSKYSIFLINVTAAGQCSVISMLDMAACTAISTIEGEKESYKGLVGGLNLYHDPLGNPIALVSASSGRVVFLSVSGAQCVPSSVWCHAAEGVPATEENLTLEAVFKLQDAAKRNGDDAAEIPTIALITVSGSVKPLRVLHAHGGRESGSDGQKEAHVFDACIWQPAQARGRELVTVGTDSLLSISRLDDGMKCFTDSMPYKSFKAPVAGKAPVHRLAIHGDVAFTVSCHEKKGTFWDLSKEGTDKKLCVTPDLGEEMRYGKYQVMCVAFSDHGIIGFTNSNDCDNPVLGFIIPTGI